MKKFKKNKKMQSENAKKKRPQNKSAKKMQTKMQKKMQAKMQLKKKTNNNAKKMQIAFFGRGFVRASNFSKFAKNLGKMQKKCEKHAKNIRKKCEKIQKKTNKNVNCIFLHFLDGVLSGLQIFSKIAKNLGKMQKKMEKNKKKKKGETNAKKNKKCKQKWKFWKCACFTKNNKFPEVAFFIACFAFCFCIFLGHGFWGCTFWVHFSF